MIKQEKDPSFSFIDESFAGDAKSLIANTYESFKKFIVSIKSLLTNLTHLKGPRMFINVLKTAISDIPIISPFYKKFLKDDSINDKAQRIQDINTFADWLSIYYYIIDFIGKSIFNLMKVVSYFNPSNLYGAIFEDENKFIEGIKEKENISIYKHVHDRMADAGISEKYIGMYLSMYATLSPFYFVLTMIDSPKTDLRDPGQYESPLGFVNKDKRTGFNAFEKKFLDDANELIEKYEDTENELEKNFLLSVQILRKTLLALITLFGIFKIVNLFPSSWKNTNVIFLYIQLILLGYVSVILFFNLMYSSIVNTENKKRAIRKTTTLNN